MDFYFLPLINPIETIFFMHLIGTQWSFCFVLFCFVFLFLFLFCLFFYFYFIKWNPMELIPVSTIALSFPLGSGIMGPFDMCI